MKLFFGITLYLSRPDQKVDQPRSREIMELRFCLPTFSKIFGYADLNLHVSIPYLF